MPISLTIEKTTSTVALSIIASMCLAQSTFAHEFWVHPAKMVVQQGTLLSVQLMHGERFDGTPVPRDDPQIKQFEFIESDGSSQSLRGMHQSTTSYLKPNSSGIVVYQSNQYQNNLDAKHFEDYLREERLGHIIVERSKQGQSDDIGREVYSRNSKSIVRIESDNQCIDQIDTEIGLPLEIVVQRIEHQSDNTLLSAQVLFNGNPIEALRVVATSEQNHDQLIELTTDSNGIVQFDANEPGLWMISTLHIERETKTDDADWESFWSSTTFEIMSKHD